MGMSLDQKAYYGWYLGHTDEIESKYNLDEEFDDEKLEDILECLGFERCYNHDYSRTFVVLREESAWDGKPIKIKDLPKVEFDAEMLQRDKEIIKNELGIELAGDPEWLCAPQYF